MYFEQAGPVNTGQTVDLALETAKARNIGHIVVASYSGETVRLLIKQEEIKIVCVTGAYGAEEKGLPTMADALRSLLQLAGVSVLSASHVLSGVERGLSSKSGGMYPAEIMSNTLRMLGQGAKVCVEASIMALDAGLVPYGKPIIALGGTGSGVDTALILTPAHANNVLGTKIHEVICKPY